MAGTSENPLGRMEGESDLKGVTEDPPLVKGTAPALVWGMGLAEEISMSLGKGGVLAWLVLAERGGLRASGLAK